MPKWIDKCVERYKKTGLSKDEAWKRCQGAYEKRKKKQRKKVKQS